MIIFLLIRHGIAEEGRLGLEDMDRALTAQGWEKTRAAMKGLVSRGFKPLRGFTSPFRRAQETMQCLLDIIEPFPVQDAEWLQHWTYPDIVEMRLRALEAECPDGSIIALVSHQPLVSELVDHLTGVFIEGKKASCTVLALDKGRFRCVEHLSPSVLRDY